MKFPSDRGDNEHLATVANAYGECVGTERWGAHIMVSFWAVTEGKQTYYHDFFLDEGMAQRLYRELGAALAARAARTP